LQAKISLEASVKFNNNVTTSLFVPPTQLILSHYIV